MEDFAASYSLSLDKTLRLPCQAVLTCNLQFIRMGYEICMQNSGQASSQCRCISVTLQNNEDFTFVQFPHAPCSHCPTQSQPHAPTSPKIQTVFYDAISCPQLPASYQNRHCTYITKWLIRILMRTHVAHWLMVHSTLQPSLSCTHCYSLQLSIQHCHEDNPLILQEKQNKNAPSF